jgi:hypothetical protein
MTLMPVFGLAPLMTGPLPLVSREDMLGSLVSSILARSGIRDFDRASRPGQEWHNALGCEKRLEVSERVDRVSVRAAWGLASLHLPTIWQCTHSLSYFIQAR